MEYYHYKWAKIGQNSREMTENSRKPLEYSPGPSELSKCLSMHRGHLFGGMQCVGPLQFGKLKI